MSLGSREGRARGGYLRHVAARPRLVASIAIGIGAFAAMPSAWHVSTRILIAWNLATWAYNGLSLWMMRGATAASIRRHAELVDESRFVVLTLAVAAAAASLGAIFAQLGAVKGDGPFKLAHLGLAALTIASAWIFTHLIFAQHYAHEFFVERESEKALPEEVRGGLRFPETLHPTYLDFLYYSFVIGCASQTADVSTTTRPMRVITLIHGIISFFFNTTILALTINIGSSLV